MQQAVGWTKPKADQEGEPVDIPWMEEGNCKDSAPEVFFPSDGAGVVVAQRICRGCPVQQTCLEYALANGIDHGVWGGTSERQRRRMMKKRRQVDAKAEAKAERLAARS